MGSIRATSQAYLSRYQIIFSRLSQSSYRGLVGLESDNDYDKSKYRICGKIPISKIELIFCQ